MQRLRWKLLINRKNFNESTSYDSWSSLWMCVYYLTLQLILCQRRFMMLLTKLNGCRTLFSLSHSLTRCGMHFWRSMPFVNFFFFWNSRDFYTVFFATPLWNHFFFQISPFWIWNVHFKFSEKCTSVVILAHSTDRQCQKPLLCYLLRLHVNHLVIFCVYALCTKYNKHTLTSHVTHIWGLKMRAYLT